MVTFEQAKQINEEAKKIPLAGATILKVDQNFINQKKAEGFKQQGNTLVSPDGRTTITLNAQNKITQIRQTGLQRSKKGERVQRFDPNSGIIKSNTFYDRSGGSRGTLSTNFETFTLSKNKSDSDSKSSKTFNFQTGEVKSKRRNFASNSVSRVQEIPGFEGGVNARTQRDSDLNKARGSVIGIASTIDRPGPTSLPFTTRKREGATFGPQQLPPNRTTKGETFGPQLLPAAEVADGQIFGPQQLDNSIKAKAGRAAAKAGRGFQSVGSIFSKKTYDETKGPVVGGAPFAIGLISTPGTLVTSATSSVPKITAAFLTKSAIVGQSSVDTVERVGETLRPINEKSVINRVGKDNFDDIFSTALRKQRSAAKDEGIVSALGENINLGFTSKETRIAFQQSVEEQGKQRGLNPAQINDLVLAAERSRSIGSIGELTAFLGISTNTEIFGRTLVAKSFAANAGAVPSSLSFAQGFKLSLKPLAIAGFGEGAFQEVASATSRKTAPKTSDVLIEGGFGAASAAVIGGTIIGSAASTKAGTRGFGKVVEASANILDPLEKPGDVFAEVAIQGTSRATGRSFTVPTFSFAPTKDSVVFNSATLTPVQTTTKTTASTKTKNKQSPTRPRKNVFGEVISPVSVPTPESKSLVRSFTPTQSRSRNLAFTSTSISTNPIVPISTNPIVPISTNPIVPSNTFVPTNTNTIVPSNTFVPTFTNVPVFTAPGFIPLNFPDGGGRGRRGFLGGGKRKDGFFKPSVVGLDLFKSSGVTQKEPRFTSGLGVRRVTKKQARRLKKDPFGLGGFRI